MRAKDIAIAFDLGDEAITHVWGALVFETDAGERFLRVVVLSPDGDSEELDARKDAVLTTEQVDWLDDQLLDLVDFANREREENLRNGQGESSDANE